MSSTRRLLGLEQPIKPKKMKKKGKSKTITDERFASAQSDPRFMEAPKRHSKVTIDSRFQRIFTDRSFASSNAPVDKRGKPKINNQRAAVSHYYQQEADDQIGKQIESESESEGDEDDDVDVDVETMSSSSTTDSEDDNYVDEEEGDTFMLQEDNVPEIDKETKRLAVVNLDWSQVRAVDLYALLTSFLPKEGRIISVSVYPSEFGLKRMEEEATRGPVGLFDDEHVEVDDYDDDDDEIDQKKLRAYELSRLRYYYAVVECDSVATSDYLYKTCDGVEFERSANKLDLRFIPDSMEFKYQPCDVATEIPSNYEGLDFQTRALQHSNIQLTWDEDEPQRAKTLKRKLTDKQIADLELKEYLASDESESEDDGEDKNCKKLDKYRALIQSGDQSDEDEEEDDGKQEMEVTFNSGLEEVSKRIIEKRNKKSETVWEAYLKKRKEKKKGSKKGSKYDSDDESDDSDEDPKDEAGDFFVEVAQETEASRAELELLTADDKLENDTNVKGYSLKPNKRKREAAIPTLDVEDPRFSALFTSPLYARDPTHPEFKRSAPYALQETQKQQKKKKKTKSTKKRA